MKVPVIKILGLDDDADDHFIIQHDLREGGVDNPCEFYDNTKDFFDNFTDNTCLALVDHVIPKVDSFEVVREIKKRAEAPSRIMGCEVIVISAQKSFDVFMRYKRMGVMDYIIKGEPDFQRHLVNSTKEALKIAQYWFEYINKWANGVPNYTQ